MEIRKGVYGLPQASILTIQLLKKQLAKYDYYKVPQTWGLWKYHTQSIQFMLVVDDFGQICPQKGWRASTKRLQWPLQSENWLDKQTVSWNHTSLELLRRYVDISMQDKFYKNMNTFKKGPLKVVYTQLLQRSMEKLTKIPSQMTLPKNCHMTRKNESNRWEAYITMPGPKISHSSFQSALLQSHRIHYGHSWITSSSVCNAPYCKN